MVERQRQIQVPKYLSPRTDTPRLTLGHGGCFSCIYSVRGAGGYQMFGVTPAPIFDPAQRLSYLKELMGFFQPDRKSTRLNSSHLVISYAVFCLKKKKY